MIFPAFTVLNDTIQIRDGLTRLTTGFLLFQWGSFLLGGVAVIGILIVIVEVYRLHQANNQKIRFLSFPGIEKIITKTNTGIWQYHLNSGLFTINSDMAIMAEVKHAKTKTKITSMIEDYVHPDDWQLIQDNIHDVLTNKSPFFITELRMKARTGGYFWATIRGAVVKSNRAKEPLVVGGTMQDISIRKERELEIQRLSYFDALTGLKNRRAYETAVLDFDLIENYPISILSADVNGLKIINDAFGHSVGDQLLLDVAQAIKSAFSCPECLFRIGGDEFVAILIRTPYEMALEGVQQIEKELALKTYHGIQASLSMGIKTKTDVTEDLKQILINAEVEMYHTKLNASWKTRADIIRGIQATLFARLPELENHAINVTEWSQKIGLMLALLPEDLDRLKQAAYFHDIGKIAIDPMLLNKYQRVSLNEKALVNQHVEFGYRILAGSNEYESIAKDVLCHHENYDGSGYPKGLKGDAIPLFSRIIHLAEAYDWMTKPLPYRPALTKPEIKNELLADANVGLDPQLVTMFIKAFLS